MRRQLLAVLLLAAAAAAAARNDPVAPGGMLVVAGDMLADTDTDTPLGTAATAPGPVATAIPGGGVPMTPDCFLPDCPARPCTTEHNSWLLGCADNCRVDQGSLWTSCTAGSNCRLDLNCNDQSARVLCDESRPGAGDAVDYLYYGPVDFSCGVPPPAVGGGGVPDDYAPGPDGSTGDDALSDGTDG